MGFPHGNQNLSKVILRFTKLFFRNFFTWKTLANISLVFQYIAFDEFLFSQLNSLSYLNHSFNFLKTLTLDQERLVISFWTLVDMMNFHSNLNCWKFIQISVQICIRMNHKPNRFAVYFYFYCCCFFDCCIRISLVEKNISAAWHLLQFIVNAALNSIKKLGKKKD